MRKKFIKNESNLQKENDTKCKLDKTQIVVTLISAVAVILAAIISK